MATPHRYPIRGRSRQPLPQLTRQHLDLPPVMGLVGHEVRKDVFDIQRKIASNEGS